MVIHPCEAAQKELAKNVVAEAQEWKKNGGLSLRQMTMITTTAKIMVTMKKKKKKMMMAA